MNMVILQKYDLVIAVLGGFRLTLHTSWNLFVMSLQWRHNGGDSVWNHQRHDCLLNHLFRRRSKKTSKLRVTGLCAGNSPETGEFSAQMASYAENVSIWWRHHVMGLIKSPSHKRPVIRSFDIVRDVLNKLLKKHTTLRIWDAMTPMWRHCNVKICCAGD